MFNNKDLYEMNEEELYKESMKKDSKGNATKRALEAQKIIWERAGKSFQSETHYLRNNSIKRKF